MRNISRAALLLAALLASCAPPPAEENETENSAAGNEATGDTSAGEEPGTPTPGPGGNGTEPLPAPPPSPLVPPPPPPPPPPERYTARGQEPGWALTIAGGRIDYQGNYGEKRIEAAAPAPTPTANGRRYVTDRLTVEIIYERCNDAMSGHGYAHKVRVTADGETYDGCGGARRTEWDV